MGADSSPTRARRPDGARSGAFFKVEVRTTAEGGAGRRRPVGRGVESGQVAGRAQGQYHDEGSEPRSSIPTPDLPPVRSHSWRWRVVILRWGCQHAGVDGATAPGPDRNREAVDQGEGVVADAVGRCGSTANTPRRGQPRPRLTSQRPLTRSHLPPLFTGRSCWRAQVPPGRTGNPR